MVRDSELGGESREEPVYDKVTQASMNGIYVKAQELDRGHNTVSAPSAAPPGAGADASTHAPSSDGSAYALGEDASTHASTHASDSDASTHASDR